MPAVLKLPAKSLFVEVHSPCESQGLDGRRVLEAAERALVHWQNRAERLLEEFEVERDPLEYSSIPLAPERFVRVRYRYAGELRPLPYEWEE